MPSLTVRRGTGSDGSGLRRRIGGLPPGERQQVSGLSASVASFGL